ncbi:sawadee homeodomain homolog 2-like protein [Drosera capensis]
MDRIQLRPRKRTSFSGFTNSEVQKLEMYFKELGEESTNKEFCVKTARAFSRREERAGKPVVKWDEIQQWFRTKLKESLAKGNVFSIQTNEIPDMPDGNLGFHVLAYTSAPLNTHAKGPTPQSPSTTELNRSNHLHDSSAHLFVRDMCTPIGANGECFTPQASSPFNSQPNEGNHLANVSKKRAVGADGSTPVKPDAERLTTLMVSLSKLNGGIYQPDASSNMDVHPANGNCRAPRTHSPTQVKESTDQANMGLNSFLRAYSCAAVQSRGRLLTTENMSPLQIKESTRFSDVGEHYKGCKDACIQKRAAEANQIPEGEKFSDAMEVEFEARSSADGAWYDVETILTHRILSSGEAEVRVRYVGYGAEEDEWVNVKGTVRERSIPVEHWECYKVRVGDLVLCFQERKDLAKFYDARVVEILRRMHDIRGCSGALGLG